MTLCCLFDSTALLRCLTKKGVSGGGGGGGEDVFLCKKTEQRHLFPSILPPSLATSCSCGANAKVDRGICEPNKGDAIPGK